MLKQDTASSVVRAAATSSASNIECAVSLSSPTLKLIRAVASITMYNDVELPLSGLFPQLASKKAAGLKLPYL